MKASTLSKISLAFVACVGLACAPGVAFAQRGGGGHGGGGGSHGGGGGGGFHGGGGGGGFHGGGGGGFHSNGSFGGGGARGGGSFGGGRSGGCSAARVEDPLAAREVGHLEDRAEERVVDRLAREAEAAAWVRHRAHADLAAGQRTGDLGAARAARRVRVLRSLMVNGIRSVGAAEIPRAEVLAGRGREQDRVQDEDFRASEIRREAEHVPR